MLLRSLALVGLFGLMGCNIQPARPDAPPPAVKATSTPPADTAPAVTAKAPVAPEPGATPPAPAEAPPSGERAEAAAPLPARDAVIAIYHTGNVEGSVEPCG
jgi:hypothetical protein